MFKKSVEQRYEEDNLFRRLVDVLRSELKLYNVTPSELRQAAMLAATMHEVERVKPVLMYVDECKLILPKMYEASTGRSQCAIPNQSNIPQKLSSIPPAMFGALYGVNPHAYTALYNRRKPKAVADRRISKSWLSNPRGKWERMQHTYTDTGREAYTGDRRKKKPVVASANLTPDRRKANAMVDRRLQPSRDTSFSKELRRYQGLYASKGWDLFTGDRRKLGRVYPHSFNFYPTTRPYRVCKRCHLSDTYVGANPERKFCQVEPAKGSIL